MFAILFTDKMDGFYAIIASFPTVIFTVMLGVSLVYWLISFFGLVDIDLLDLESGDSGEIGNVNGVAGVLMKLGLNGVPLPIVITLVSLIGWLLSYYTVFILTKFLAEELIYILGIVIFFGAAYISALITAFIIRPLRSFFKQADRFVEKRIEGQIATVRTGRVDKEFGEAVVEDGGAGLIVRVRSYKDEVFSRGDRVALLEFDKVRGIYKVISEQEFNGK